MEIHPYSNLCANRCHQVVPQRLPNLKKRLQWVILIKPGCTETTIKQLKKDNYKRIMNDNMVISFKLM